jgi:NDP-sugar pyrophosphorylase family protein
MTAAVPERAVILAAGLGSRLQPFTNTKPKPLVEVHGTPILHNALEILANAGVTETTIVVGYRKEAIIQSCGARLDGMRIIYAESDAYERTGSAYSLWLARDALLNGDALVLEGDVLFEREVLARLLSSSARDVAALAAFTDKMTGSAVTLSLGGLVEDFRMNQTAANLNGTPLYKTMNLYRFSAETLRGLLVPALDRLIWRGDMKAYLEQILAHIVNERGLRLAAAECDDLRWFEIDSEEDLRIAEAIFAPAAAPLLARIS